MLDIAIWRLIKNVDEFVKHIKRGDQIIINAFTKIDKLNSAELNKLKKRFSRWNFCFKLKEKRYN